MPKLWTETVETHRHQVREAILHATWELVTRHGLAAVTMSRIAETTGIGRATLYKYFPDVESILGAWHQQHLTAHLAQLSTLSAQRTHPRERLTAVLEAYADITRQRHRHGAELVALLHRDEAVAEAQRQLTDLFRGLITEAVEAGAVRADIAPEELAGYCLHALGAAAGLPSKAAAHRLVTVILAGLRPPAS